MSRARAILTGLLLIALATPLPADEGEVLLRRWAHARELKGLPRHGTGRVIRVDRLFRTEEHALFEFWFGPDGWRIDTAPNPAVTQSRWKAEDGTPFELKPVSYSRQIYLETEFHHFNGDAADVLGVLVISERDQPRSWLAQFLPDMGQLAVYPPQSPAYPIWRSFSGREWFETMSSMGSPSLPVAWHASVGPLAKSKSGRPQIHVILEPHADEYRRALSRFECVLRPGDYSPIASRITDPTGNSFAIWNFDHFDDRADPSAFQPSAVSNWPPRIR